MAPLFSLVATVCLADATSAWSLASRAHGDLCLLYDQRVAVVGNRLFFMDGQYIYQDGQNSTQQSLSWIYLNESFPIQATIRSDYAHSVPVPDHDPIILDADFWSDDTTLFLRLALWEALPVQGGDLNFGRPQNALFASVPYYGLSFLAAGDTVPIGGMLVLDPSNTGAPKWKNLTDGNGSRGTRIPLIDEGEMVYVRAGNRGLWMAVGGYDTSYNGTQFRHALWLWDQRGMDQISVYDIESSTWFTVTATGDVPRNRTLLSSTVSSSPDDSSFQITLHGGWDLYNDAALEDVYVLAIPAFVWIKITDINNADLQSGKVDRPRAQVPAVWGNREMIMLGGLVIVANSPRGGGALNKLSCNPPYPPIRILDTTTFTWKANLNPRPSYTVPSGAWSTSGSGKAILSRQVRGANQLNDV
ncbi:MAG: hypothetical protein M1826_001010 [Phylliscum demangeonii]|nr:MAG: hypothetical protein M1826_001010 [Phylliscum demangeonii]